MINYLLYRLGMFFALNLPLNVTYKIATFIADTHFFISKKDRTAAIDNLRVIFNRHDEKLYYIAKAAFRNFAKYLVDFFRFSKIDNNFIKKYVKVKNIEYVDNALKKGKGVIAVSAHLGNWELGGAVLGKLGYPTNVIALDHENKLINNIFIRQRARMGVKVISIGIMLRECFRALKRGEVLGLLGDRDFTVHGVYVDFFGKNILIPKGPAVFSIKSGAPLIPLFLLRNPDNSFTFVFEKEIDYKPTGNFDNDVKTVTEKFVAVLEEYIKKYPDQWYMFRRFWNAI